MSVHTLNRWCRWRRRIFAVSPFWKVVSGRFDRPVDTDRLPQGFTAVLKGPYPEGLTGMYAKKYAWTEIELLILYLMARDGLVKRLGRGVRNSFYTALAAGLLSYVPGCSKKPTEPEPVLEQIAFWSNRDQGTGELYTMNLDGTDLRRLTNNAVNDLHPFCSPDGSKIVFSSNREDVSGNGLLNNALYVIEFDGSNPQRITPDGLKYAAAPVWGANGKIIFNYWDYDGTQGISSINLDGTEYERIIEEHFHNWLSGRPAVSPDCSQIAFTTDRDGNLEVYIANIDGTNQWNLTNTSSYDETSPVWSPDGNGLFFYKGEIYYQDILGSIPEQITFNIGAIDPAISPDGGTLLFVGQTGWYNLYVKNLSNVEVTRLTFSETEMDPAFRYPAWRPRPNN